jgi:hypothetical protein
MQNINTNIPTERELPSTQKLVKSTILAAATAAVLLVTVVMPAEYGIDPTGIGNLIGLKKMGEIRVSLAACRRNAFSPHESVQSSEIVG